jgi:hypothetical protein
MCEIETEYLLYCSYYKILMLGIGRTEIECFELPRLMRLVMRLCARTASVLRRRCIYKWRGLVRMGRTNVNAMLLADDGLLFLEVTGIVDELSI